MWLDFFTIPCVTGWGGEGHERFGYASGYFTPRRIDDGRAREGQAGSPLPRAARRSPRRPPIAWTLLIIPDFSPILIEGSHRRYGESHWGDRRATPPRDLLALARRGRWRTGASGRR